MNLGPRPDLSHPIRSASWIWPVTNFLPRHHTHAHFRRELVLDEVPARVPCHITADAQYVLRVNGEHINRGPARGFQTAWPFDTHDLARHLRPGRNVIAVTAYNPGRGTFLYVHEAAAGLLAAIELPGETVVTDTTWQSRVDPSQARLTPITSIQMGHQEHGDLARTDDWETAESLADPPADQLADQPAEHPAPVDPFGLPPAAFAWHAPEHVQPFGQPPWNDLTERCVPPLTTNLLGYGEPIATAGGPGHRDEDPTAAWWAYHRQLNWKDPVPTDENGVRVRLYDLKTIRLGTLIVEVPANPSSEDTPTRVDLLYVQAVDEHGVPLLDDPDTASHISLASRLHLGPEPRTWEAFLPMGHRYLAVVVHGGADLDLKPRLRETVHPLVATGAFATDEPALDDIWNLCLVTQRACLTDAYTDTPWREQAQWWGDARVQSQNHFHLVPDDSVLVRGLRQIGHQRLPNGLTYGHAPTVAHSCVLPDFTLTWIITLWDHFWQTGDPAMLLEQREGVERALAYFRNTTEGLGENGLLQADSRYWLFLDWCDIHKSGTPTLLNLWHILALRCLAELHEAAGEADQARAFRNEQDQQVQRFNALLLDESTGLCRDGLTAEGEPVDRFSVQNQTLALLLGLGNADAQKQRIADYLAGELRGGADPSSYWITYLYDAAEKLGLEAEMLDHIVRHWTRMLPHGGCWESFETLAKIRQESVSHAWAAHPLFHFMRALGGIRQTAPGWTHVLFRPVLHRPTCARADVAFPTPLGVIDVAWVRDNGRADVRLTVPEGITAEVDLPGVQTTVQAGEHRWTVSV